jgi:hypothetical protein
MRSLLTVVSRDVPIGIADSLKGLQVLPRFYRILHSSFGQYLDCYFERSISPTNNFRPAGILLADFAIAIGVDHYRRTETTTKRGLDFRSRFTLHLDGIFVTTKPALQSMISLLGGTWIRLSSVSFVS